MRTTGIGTRVLNFLIDTILIALISYGIYKVRMYYVTNWKWSFIPYYIFFYGTLFAYYFLFELIFARTPGKWFSISKVVTKDGGKPGVVKVFLRSILRLTIIDPFFIPVWEKPLHDKLSQTEVIEA